MSKIVADYKKYEKLRDAREYSDYQVMKMTGISTATLSNWKSGNYTPKVDKIMLLAKLFNVPVEFLMTETE